MASTAQNEQDNEVVTDDLPKVGEVVKFLGYEEGVAEDEKVFSAGELLQIISFDEATSGFVVADGPEEGARKGMVFPTEIEALSDSADDEVEVVTLPEEGVVFDVDLSDSTQSVEAEAVEPAKKTRKPREKKEKIASSKDADDKVIVNEFFAEAERKLAEKQGVASKVAVAPVKGKRGPKPGAKAAAKEAAKEASKETAKPVIKTSRKVEKQPKQEHKEVKESLATVAVSDSTAVSHLLEQQDALAAAKSLVLQTEETFFTLGGVLAHVYREDIYKTIGYDGKEGFNRYVETELNMHYRKAMTLIQIYNYFRGLGIDEKRLAVIGWSKAKEMVERTTAANFEEDVEYAKTHSRDELVNHMSVRYVKQGGTDGEKVKKVKLNFSLYQDQSTMVVRALDEAKALLGENSTPEQALEYICSEWCQMTENVKVPLEDAIGHIESKYGVSVAIQ